jgi:hypothetical protein
MRGAIATSGVPGVDPFSRGGLEALSTPRNAGSAELARVRVFHLAIPCDRQRREKEESSPKDLHFRLHFSFSFSSSSWSDPVFQYSHFCLGFLARFSTW